VRSEFQRRDVEYQIGSFQACNLSGDDVEKYAEKVAQEGELHVGGDVIKMVYDLDGFLHYQSRGHLDDGSLYVHGFHDFDIILPTFTSETRDQFTIAHELGHYFLHSQQGKIPLIAFRIVDIDTDRAEWEANWFAAALLMPEIPFREAFQSTSSIISVARKFNVSPQVAEIRKKVLDARPC
jgi:hypothetical protein